MFGGTLVILPQVQTLLLEIDLIKVNPYIILMHNLWTLFFTALKQALGRIIHTHA